MKPTGFFYDALFLDHAPPAGHPERADRLKAVIAHLQRIGLLNHLIQCEPRQATEKELLAVHTPSHVELVKRTCALGGGLLDEGDTFAVRKSYEVATLAAGSVLGAIDAVIAKEVHSAFCAVRPPGHHAEHDKPMGFCLFNNVAVGARYAQQNLGLGKVAILDWDVHHGNGTQHIFEDDASVFYISLHQYPFYPGTGARNETGRGEGKGFTLNIPLPANADEHAYKNAFDDEVLPALSGFKPDLLIISSGFDAHREDPLGGILLTEESFGWMTRAVLGIAPVVSVLEGGYNLDALARSVEQHLIALGE